MKSVSTKSYYYYTVYFPHTSIVPNKEIRIFDIQVVEIFTIQKNDPDMNYGTGTYVYPGAEENSIAARVSTASYYVLFDTSKLVINYEDVVFKIDKSLVVNPSEQIIRATFEYWSIAIGIRDIESVIDGRRDTQLQLQFYGEPLSGFHLATVDLGDDYTVQAIDIVGGFFMPDDYRKFDVSFTISMQYSLDGIDFYPISEKTEQFLIKGGESVTFEEEELGIGFTARYLKFNLYDVERINYGKGRYVVALTELSVYDDIILDAEAYLIPKTTLTARAKTGDTVVYVNDTSAFTEPTTGTATAYLNKTHSFTYTGLESGARFTGCVIGSGIDYGAGYTVTQSIADDLSVYDEDELLPHLGCRVSKEKLISDRNLYNLSQTKALAKAFLLEYYKDHTKAKVDVIYAPHLMMGQTVSVTDTYNNVSGVLYFIESITENSTGIMSLVLARYPVV
jgi:hypothetical protein